MLDSSGRPPMISVVIPVYNSAAIVGESVNRTVAYLEGAKLDYEIILVNDGSDDASWEVLAEKAAGNRRIVAVNLLRNYGQHTAVFCGLQYVAGDYVVTMDDDLQNPPEEIGPMLAKAQEGFEVVYGRFREKRHPAYRRAGSLATIWLNRHIFGLPSDLVVTNFRVIRRDVVERIKEYRTNFPYITGLSLMFSTKRANVWVDHQPRRIGASKYGFTALASLMGRILFNYSTFPLRLLGFVGISAATSAFVIGGIIFARALLSDVRVAGWASTVILISFFGGLNMLFTTILGEYVLRLLRQTSESHPYCCKALINGRH